MTTFLPVHNITIWYFLHIEFYEIISVETQTCHLQWAAELEFTSERLTRTTKTEATLYQACQFSISRHFTALSKGYFS